MDRIPIHLNNPYTGIIKEASTAVNDKYYYDGSNNLSAIHVTCNLYTANPQGCTGKSGCGWCGDRGKCIPGNASGPLAPCLRNTFLFTAPTPEWNPLKSGHINILTLDSKGLPLNRITPEPELNKIDVYKPYK
jgi:hypothetical protein